jgi:L-fuconolactonase
MRVDAHQHFWRYSAAEYGWIDDSMAALRRDFLPEDLAPEMARAGVDACVTVQVRQTLEETRWMLDLAAGHAFIAGVVGWVDLRADDAERQIESFAAHAALVGVRHIVQSEPDDGFMAGRAFRRGIGALAAHGLTYDILIYPRHLGAAADLVEAFPAQVFVLDHLAKPEIRTGAIADWARGIARLAAAPRVYCKLSGLVTEADWRRWTPQDIRPYLDVAFEYFGPDRLIAGSDWPVCTLAADYSRTMSVLDAFLESRPAAERDAVLGGNAVRVWGLGRGK